MMGKNNDKGKTNFLYKWMNNVERVGNKLPEPPIMFMILSAFVIILSGLLHLLSIEAVHPGTGEVIEVVNLVSRDGIRRIWSEAVSNFTGFAPLGMVLITIIGSAVAEKSGFLIGVMQTIMAKAKPSVVTFLILFVGINANIAGDAGYIIMPSLAAIIYLGMKRHPLLGMFIAFAGVSAGFSANLVLGMSDAIVYGFTESAAQIIQPDYVQSPAINWYFMFVSTFLLCSAGTILVEKVLVQRFKVSDEKLAEWNQKKEHVGVITNKQRLGMRRAAIGLVIFIIVIILTCIGERPLLGDAETGSIMSATSPFMSGLVITITLMLLIPGACYGFTVGKYTKVADLFADITEGFSEMSSYILMSFFIAQFTAFFSWSNLGTVLSIKGASALESLDISGIPLLLGLVFVSGLVNLFIGSASAKWAILAPVFVPLMMLMGYDPAITQIAYRIGDSITNPLSPIFVYLPIILGFARRYDKQVGIGTIIANMTPFSITFAIVWIIQMIIWFLLGLPLGPGGGIYL